MNEEIEDLILKLERDRVPFARDLVNDIITHFNMLKIKITKFNVVRVLVKCSDELLIKYENGNKQGCYDLYNIVEDVFYIESSEN